MADYPIGGLIAARVRAMGVKPFYKRFRPNGVNGPNMAAVYSDRGHGVRAPMVFYNRANEAAAKLQPGDLDWRAIFDSGVRWFHSGGIFAALSATTGDVILEAVEAAHAAGVVVSFDLNYREKLWNAWGGPFRAVEVLSRIVQNVDVLVGNEEDLQKALGIQGPQAEAASPLAGSSIDAGPFLAMIDCVVRRFPQIKVVATTVRNVLSANRHCWSAVAWMNGRTYVAPCCEHFLDRVGGGDGFSSGCFYGLLTDAPPEEAVRLGWAHGALLTTYPGDTTMASLAEVRALANSGNSRIRR